MCGAGESGGIWGAGGRAAGTQGCFVVIPGIFVRFSEFGGGASLGGLGSGRKCAQLARLFWAVRKWGLGKGGKWDRSENWGFGKKV